MRKTISILIALIILSSVLSSFVSAQEPSATPLPSSYELFYPVVAGKTQADKFYFLKTAREWLAEKLISDHIRRADYHLVLSKKRLVEAEKLVGEKNYALAKKSIEACVVKFNKAVSEAKRAQDAGKKVTDINHTIVIVGKDEADFIDISLMKDIPDSERESFINASKSIRELIQKI